MMPFKTLISLVFLTIGIGYNATDASASEPSIYSKILTPSPLGKDRVLVFCSIENTDSETFASFYKSVRWDEFDERDLTLVEVSKSTVATIFGKNYKNSHGNITAAKHHDHEEGLRKKANCKDEFEFVLIGKDTGVKKRWKSAPSLQDIFQTIDAMPMRQYEMRTRGGN